MVTAAKGFNMIKNAYLLSQVATAKWRVQAAVNNANLPDHPLGHAFLWGYVTTYYKNGKPKVIRACLGSICTSELSRAVAIAESIPNVSGVWYNLD